MKTKSIIESVGRSLLIALSLHIYRETAVPTEDEVFIAQHLLDHVGSYYISRDGKFLYALSYNAMGQQDLLRFESRDQDFRTMDDYQLEEYVENALGVER